MWNLLILLLAFFLLQRFVIADSTYECGEHGRFEYCIDEIPGCVIGCHCHPGYYFDTDTKICEPNSKLLEHHRRHYVGEPTRVQIDITPPDTPYIETTTTKNMNSHVNEIAKDADDLGDWLYNQFFKTIESQVVNNTNQKETLTRRSGSNYKMKKPKRTNKWNKGKKKYRKRSRNKKSKKNLLRINENDSLFDIDSSSSSDSSGSSSASVSSDEFQEKEDVHENENEHGHKKIVMINKKPKPPLPSFIFLPNIDTSFYPPIGLPPPPIVPMYPMVPVPPVVPLLPIPDNCETTSLSSTTNDVTAKSMDTSKTTVDETTDTAPQETETEAGQTEAAATEITKTDTETSKPDALLNKLKPNGRQKILQRLQAKAKKPPKVVTDEVHKKIKKTPFMNDDAEVPFLDNTIPVDANNNDMQYNPWQEDPSSVPDNVDFKYITELIHRVDLKNKTNDLLPPIEYNPLDSIEVYKPKRNKNYYQYYDTPLNAFERRRSNRNNEKLTDDSYYTNLGRQIATMIRGIDAQNKQANIEMEKANDKFKTDPYYNKNSAQSFWERSVRSPLTFLNANRNKFEYLKKSNEILFNIENRVEIMASTAPALSLREIENIVKAMEAAKMDIQQKESNVGDKVSSNKNLDIKLWPPEFKISGKINRPELMKKDDDNNEVKDIANNNQADNDKTLRVQNVQKVLNLPNQNLMENNQRARQTPEIKLIKNPSVGNTYFASNPLNYNQLRYGVANQRQTKAGALPQKPSAQLLLENEMNPLFLKHRKYFQDNNNNNAFSNNRELAQYSRASLISEPSYFHHEINHFDYF
ncbi:hypothetical protein KGM_207396 [Danaus plexippus plexippus]|uniref:Uncharacterized protein n=1 Tax=Danaus plexippus plexippus TaxID=278856 RepID=A0A212FH23_DANPL|nr:hypothetical protein KGM_207396 [Danaus plexippus plexippus]